MQYAHTHTQEYSIPGTLAIEGLVKEHLHMMFTQHSTQLMMLAGLSIASPHDQFTKKIGREIANKRVAPIAFAFLRFKIEGTKHFYDFMGTMKVGYKTYNVQFTTTTVLESNTVKVIEASIYD